MLPAERHDQAIRSFLAVRLGDHTRLRLASENDAAFLLGLRLDPARNQNISTTSPDFDAQVVWMRGYAARYELGREAYFIIEGNGAALGSLRLYDYIPERDSFCWGSWIICPGAPPATAYQSAIIAYDLAFGPLCFARSHFDVRQANRSVWRFHEKMGAKLVREDALDRFYEFDAEDYRKVRARFLKFTQERDFP